MIGPAPISSSPWPLGTFEPKTKPRWAVVRSGVPNETPKYGKLPALAEAFPDCEWHYMASSPASEILAGNPLIKSCVSSPEMPGPVDVAICYNSGGYWRELIQATKGGIPNRVGYVHKGFSALVTNPIEIDHPQPYPAYFRDLIAQLTALRPLICAQPVIPGRTSCLRRCLWS